MEKDTFLNDILEKLDTAIKAINAEIKIGEKDIESMQEYYWLNYTEMDEFGYESYDNQRSLFLQENNNQEARILRSRYQKMQNSPYFGRVDFVYEGEAEPEIFYIGIGNFSPERGGIPLIFDWRAPVSSLFYDYDSGGAGYEAPGGYIRGTITGKGQYKIRKGKIIYAIDSDVKIDDEVLLKELSDKGSNRLKNIIQTIQKEQNAIIRNKEDRIMVIQGVAGSGKTSVALHRIAYLLYHDRNFLKSKNVLILSPNGIFADYISHILPELGEENILEMSFDTFAYRELKGIAPDCEERGDLIEQMMEGKTNNYSEKSSRDFVAELDGYVLELEADLFEARDVHIRKWTKPAGEIEKLFYFKMTDFPIMTRLDMVMEKVVDEYETLTGQNVTEEEMEELRCSFDKMLECRDIYVLYSRFLESMGMKGLPHLQYEKRYIRYEDVYPLLYLKYSLLTHREHKQIKHLVIDEMQDYSYLQYRIIDLLFKCKMTILGDLAQTMDDAPRDVARFLPSILGRDIKYVEMKKSYRNTVEIAEYAAGLINAETDFFDRHGGSVEVIRCGDESRFDESRAVDRCGDLSCIDAVCDCLRDASKYETIAVITFTEKEATYLYEQIVNRLEGDVRYDSELDSRERYEDSRNSDSERKSEGEGTRDLEISLINKDSKYFKVGLTVLPYYLAKGLEFEKVIFIDHDDMLGDIFTQARYIAATRALHELTVIKCE